MPFSLELYGVFLLGDRAAILSPSPVNTMDHRARLGTDENGVNNDGSTD